MIALLGTSLPVFIAVTLFLGGGAAFMTGQALSAHWRPVWQAVGYSMLLGLADRFIIFSLFGGELLSLSGYVIDTAVIMAVALLSYRATRARTMVAQYPWLYERAGPFGWRERRAG
ncbi:hypothetical protein HBA54_00605 [Pelagibius litoralis]|uniref:DUF6867 domain-containing protein n=1 Tax=Pelagibius litoralis TaxID=374515 RepID=A0A967EUF2_9PROT|nr:hypothetical protein [Pelagibius litoralis]NIA67086.1 hypothetical protein [Pelagibius litoralis]